MSLLRAGIDAIGPYLDLTLVAAPFVVVGYRLGKRGDPRAWLCLMVGNVLLLITGALSAFHGSPHLGLLVSAYLIFEGIRNYLTLRRARPNESPQMADARSPG